MKKLVLIVATIFVTSGTCFAEEFVNIPFTQQEAQIAQLQARIAELEKDKADAIAIKE